MALFRYLHAFHHNKADKCERDAWQSRRHRTSTARPVGHN